MQILYASHLDPETRFELPDEGDELLPGVLCGRPAQLFTPAYWAMMARRHALHGTYGNFKTGRNLLEEYIHCILGGYGVTGEMSAAAAEHVIGSGIIECGASAADYESLLSEPLIVLGRTVRYRFPRQKAQFIAASIADVRKLEARDLDDLSLRGELMSLPGVGPKIASWIVRNDRGSDDVAIVDVHITRVGKFMGLFAEKATPTKNYFEMERAFLAFAHAIGIRASILDHMMWDVMRTAS